MTQEEKAKAYDRVSKEVKDFFEGKQKMYSDVNQTLEYLFPELAESKDEKIRKALIEHFKFNVQQILYDFSNKDVLAWLENQKDCIKLSDSVYTSNRDVIEFADKYSHTVWEKLMDKFKKNENYSIGCNDVSDIVLNAIINTYNWLKKQSEQGKDILEDAIILDGNEDGLIAETIRYKNEKQAEQKLDKVEPKFKVGDWIINPRTGLIKHIKNVLLCNNNGNYEFESSSMSIDSVDNSFHLWTIQDAKDGDVLVTRKKQPFIFKNYDEDTDYIYAYCGICDLVKDNSFYADDDQLWTCYSVAGDVYPATKEQRDLLFQKMKEAGYTFDFEKKELKKIEQNLAENAKPQSSTPMSYGKELEERMYEACDRFYAPNTDSNRYSASDLFYAGVKAERDLNTLAWSEEGEGYFDTLIGIMNERMNCSDEGSMVYNVYKKAQDWLKSLKGRVQPKQEWSDVDKDMLFRIIDDLKFLRDTISTDPKYAVNINDVEREITWLKFLRPQNKWKPSDEQMEALDWQVENTSVSSWQYKATKELMEDLKKLKG